MFRLSKFVLLPCVFWAAMTAVHAEEGAATLEAWQGAMAQGCKSMQQQEFAAAEKAFTTAGALGKELHSAEACFWSSYLLAGALEYEGRYAEAEQAARAALAQPNGEMAYDALVETLSHEGKLDEAIEVAKKYVLTKQERAAQVAIKPVLRTRFYKDYLKQQTGGSGWVSVRFRVGVPGEKTPLAFVWDSTADAGLEKQALQHVAVADAEGLDSKLKRPFDVVFTYDYDRVTAMQPHFLVYSGMYYRTGWVPPEHNAMEYRQTRQRLALLEKELGADHPQCIQTIGTAASKLVKAERYGEAETAYRGALEKLDASASKDDYLRCWIMTALGDVLMKEHKYADAQPVLESARKLREKLYPANAYLEQDPTVLLAKALTKLHRGDEAKALVSDNKTK